MQQFLWARSDCNPPFARSWYQGPIKGPSFYQKCMNRTTIFMRKILYKKITNTLFAPFTLNRNRFNIAKCINCQLWERNVTVSIIPFYRMHTLHPICILPIWQFRQMWRFLLLPDISCFFNPHLFNIELSNIYRNATGVLSVWHKDWIIVVMW